MYYANFLCNQNNSLIHKDALAGQKQFLATESPLKMIENASPKKHFSFSRY